MIQIAFDLVVVTVLAGCCWFIYQIAMQHGRLLVRTEVLENVVRSGLFDQQAGQGSQGLPVGSVLNDFELPVLTGGSMTLTQWRGKRLLIIFFNPTCGFCPQMVPELEALSERNVLDPQPLIISTGSAEENRRLFAGRKVSYPVLLQEDSEVALLYHAEGTPMGYLVDDQGRTASKLLSGGPALLSALQSPELVTASQNTDSKEDSAGNDYSRPRAESELVRNGLVSGTVAPDFNLPMPGGGELRLNDYRGQRVMLVFSDPDCVPCSALAPQLEQIHKSSDQLKVVMISRGDVEENRKKIEELSITFPVGLQRNWEISRAYGMFATPIGYLIDEKGTLASGVAVGGPAILNLAAEQPLVGSNAAGKIGR